MAAEVGFCRALCLLPISLTVALKTAQHAASKGKETGAQAAEKAGQVFCWLMSVSALNLIRPFFFPQQVASQAVDTSARVAGTAAGTVMEGGRMAADATSNLASSAATTAGNAAQAGLDVGARAAGATAGTVMESGRIAGSYASAAAEKVTEVRSDRSSSVRVFILCTYPAFVTHRPPRTSPNLPSTPPHAESEQPLESSSKPARSPASSLPKEPRPRSRPDIKPPLRPVR